MIQTQLREADYNRKSRYQKDFIHKRQLKDPRFGPISIIQFKKNKELLAVVEKKVNSKKDAGKEILNCRKRM